MRQYIPGSNQIESVTDAIRQDCRTHTSSMVATKVVWLSCLHHPIVKSETPSEDSGIGPLHIFKGYTSVLEALVYNFQQLALLGVHIGSFNIVDAEKAVLEFT